MSDDQKGFRIVDEKKGIFELWDKAFATWRRWKVDDEATPGQWIIQKKLDGQVSKINAFLPTNGDLSKEKTRELIKKHLEALSDEEKVTYFDQLDSVSNKQLVLMTGYIEPVDVQVEDGLYCGIWDTKVEFFASCLSKEDDTKKISSFFLTHLSGSTTSPEPKEPEKKGK